MSRTYHISCPNCGDNNNIISSEGEVKNCNCPQCGYKLSDLFKNSNQLYNYGLKLVEQRKYYDAFVCFKFASKLGNPSAMYELGLIYLNYNGDDINLLPLMKNRERDLKYSLEQSANRGYLPAKEKIKELKDNEAIEEVKTQFEKISKPYYNAYDEVLKLYNKVQTLQSRRVYDAVFKTIDEVYRKITSEKNKVIEINKKINDYGYVFRYFYVLPDPYLIRDYDNLPEYVKKDVAKTKEFIDYVNCLHEVSNIKKQFDLLEKPYFLKKEVVKELYFRLKSFGNIKNLCTWQGKLNYAYDEIVKQEAIVDKLNQDINKLNSANLDVEKVKEIYREYNLMPPYLRGLILKKEILMFCYKKACESEEKRNAKQDINKHGDNKNEKDLKEWQSNLDNIHRNKKYDTKKTIDDNSLSKHNSAVSKNINKNKFNTRELSDYEVELKFFDSIRQIVKSEYDNIVHDYENYKYNTYGNNDERNTQTALDEYYQLTNEKWKSIVKEPYFVRIKKKDGEDFYIGKQGFDNIVDWRNEKASAYYNRPYTSTELDLVREFNIVNSSFGGYRDVFDSSKSNNNEYQDEVLAQVIQANRIKNQSNKDVISTLVKSQYDIIKYDPNKNILVNGCAGSGKTMIMFHRIAWLDYNKKIENTNVYTIFPNELLCKEASEFSNMLNIKNTKICAFYEFLKEIIVHYAKDFKFSYPEHYFDKYNSFKNKYFYSKEFADDIINSINELIFSNNSNHKQFISFLKDKLVEKYNDYCSMNSSNILNEDNKYYNFFVVLYLLAENTKQNFKFEDKGLNLSNDYKSMLKKLIEDLPNDLITKSYMDKVKQKFPYIGKLIDENGTNYKCTYLLLELLTQGPKKYKNEESKFLNEEFKNIKSEKSFLDIFNCYLQIAREIKKINDFENNNEITPWIWEVFNYTMLLKKTERNVSNEMTFDFEILDFIYVLINYLGPMNRKALVLIDEYQNYSKFELEIIKMTFKDIRMNVFGDELQTYLEKGIGNEENLKSYIKENNYDSFKLMVNYRNAKSITEFVNEKLNTNMTAIGLEGDVEFVDSLNKINVNANEKIALIIKDYEVLNHNMLEGINTTYDIINMNSTIKSGVLSIIEINMVGGLEFDAAIIIEKNMSKNEKYVAYTRALRKLYLINSNNY